MVLKWFHYYLSSQIQMDVGCRNPFIFSPILSVSMWNFSQIQGSHHWYINTQLYVPLLWNAMEVMTWYLETVRFGWGKTGSDSTRIWWNDCWFRGWLIPEPHHVWFLIVFYFPRESRFAIWGLKITFCSKRRWRLCPLALGSIVVVALSKTKCHEDALII